MLAKEHWRSTQGRVRAAARFRRAREVANPIPDTACRARAVLRTVQYNLVSTRGHRLPHSNLKQNFRALSNPRSNPQPIWRAFRASARGPQTPPRLASYVRHRITRPRRRAGPRRVAPARARHRGTHNVATPAGTWRPVPQQQLWRASPPMSPPASCVGRHLPRALPRHARA